MTNTAQPHSHPRTSSDRIDRLYPSRRPQTTKVRRNLPPRLPRRRTFIDSTGRPRRNDRGLNMEGGHPRRCWGADGGIDVNVRNPILDRNSRRMPSVGKPVRFQQCGSIEERKMRDMPERATCMIRHFSFEQRYNDDDDANSFDSPYRNHGEHSIARMRR